jgi:drug/metabolite transporter (DMT)-like permease
MKNLSRVQWYLLAVVFAFASFISFININGAWADEHDFNGLVGFLGVGLVSILFAFYCLFKAK